MKKLGVEVLYEDNHLLVLNKPAPLATMGAEKGEASLVQWGKDYLKLKYQKPGNVFLGVVSRLDSFTSGVIVLARTSKAASRLSSQFRENKVGKLYLAVSEGRLELSQVGHYSSVSGASPLDSSTDLSNAEQQDPLFFKNLAFPVQWDDVLFKDDQARRMRAEDKQENRNGQKGRAGQKSQKATLQLCALAHSAKHQIADRSLALVRLVTGRKHQIRVQFSSRGYPIFGDQKYQAQQKLSQGIALHCYGLQFRHPTTKEVMTFFSKPSKVWNTVGKFQVEPELWKSVLQFFSRNSASQTMEDCPIQGNVQSVLEEFEKIWFSHSLPANVFCS